jgi:hypothetical protein
MNKFYAIDDVKAAARGCWPGVLSRFGVDTSLLTDRHSPCPGCGGRDRFRFDDKGGDGTWICSGGGDFQSGDGVGLLMHVRGWHWKEAVNALGESLGLDGKEFEGRRVETGVANKPEPKKEKMNELFDVGSLRDFTSGIEPVTVEWFMDRSPLDPRRITPGEFLDVSYAPGERVVVFTNFYSQGDFAWEAGRGGFRLGGQPGVKAVKSALPLDGGKDGVWFLNNPVSLKWEPNPRKQGEKSRRTKECVTSWKYLVLECDEGKRLKKEGRIKEGIEVDEMWLKFLAAFPDPIRAIYSSGGGSWHALVAVERDSWAGMDGLLKGNPQGRTAGQRLGCKALWARYGADPAALTPVRLTRLPGCLRGGKEQKLIYLNPAPRAVLEVPGKTNVRRIVDLVPRRKVVAND